MDAVFASDSLCTSLLLWQDAIPTKITVIIPARNEAKYIGNCLQSIIAQSYPAHLFEVIVVDDHSTDGTALIVQNFKRENIHCIYLKDYVSDKLNSYKKKI